MFNKKCISELKFRTLIFIFLLIFIQLSLLAQNKGLSRPQDQASLPKSRAIASLPTPIPKISKQAKLVSTQDNEWIISACKGDQCSCNPYPASASSRNMSLWQDVRLKVTSDTQIADPHAITDLPLPDTTNAKR